MPLTCTNVIRVTASERSDQTDLSEAALPHAVLWDMDGTLIDSEHHWMAAQYDLTGRFDVPWNEADSLASVGRALPDSARVLRERGVDMPEPVIIDFLVDSVVERQRAGIGWQPGAREFLHRLVSAGVPCALVTMSYRKVAEQVVASAPAGLFRAIVTGDDVTHGKPHPEPYLTAAQQLGVDPAMCVAFEDSFTGVRSAEAAGAKVVVVHNIVDMPNRPGRSYLSSLESITMTDLASVAAGRVIDRRTI